MTGICGADESVVAGVYKRGQFAEGRTYAVSEGFWIYAFGLCTLSYFATVFIGSSAKNYLFTSLPGYPGQHVGLQQLHAKPNMRVAINIGNRGGNVVLHYS